MKQKVKPQAPAPVQQGKHTFGDLVIDGSLIIGGVNRETYNGEQGVVVAEINYTGEYDTPTAAEKLANAARIVECWNGWDALQEENRALKYLTDQMHLNMQYYMEYCQANGYVTPMDWIANQKHFK